MSGLPAWNSGAERQIGDTQLDLLRRAHERSSGQLMLDPRTQNREWCAMKRMVRRGLFTRHVYGGQGVGYAVIYAITDAGRRKLRTCR